MDKNYDKNMQKQYMAMVPTKNQHHEFLHVLAEVLKDGGKLTKEEVVYILWWAKKGYESAEKERTHA